MDWPTIIYFAVGMALTIFAVVVDAEMPIPIFIGLFWPLIAFVAVLLSPFLIAFGIGFQIKKWIDA